MEKKRIAIIGAGVSGLTACKHAIEKGFRPVVFEGDDRIGGVWARTMALTRLQTMRPAYQFTDFPWPETVTEVFPDVDQVVKYLNSYANKYELFGCIKFKSKVVGIEFVGASEEEIMGWEMWSGNGEAFGGSSKGVWNVKVEQGDDSQVEIYEFDFVILCVGRYSGLPNIPSFPEQKGPEVFNGKVMHSMEFFSMDTNSATQLIKGKHVTIVGNQKSALDIADMCAKINGIEFPCTMICRTKRWNIPHYYAWGIHISLLYLNRFSELLLHKPGEGFLQCLLATFLLPLGWIRSKFCESYYKRAGRMKKFGIIPDHSFSKAVGACAIAILPEKFCDRVEEGSIILKHSKSFDFCKNGVNVEGQHLPINSDVVIFATGYKGDQKLSKIFISKFFQKIMLGSPTSTVPLYRECIHPRIPQLAVIGYSESIANLYTSELRAKWLTHFLDDGFQLPNIKLMEHEILEWEKFMKRYSKENFRRSSISMVHIWYNDILCKDIGCNPKRKKSFFAEWFEPYGPSDYANLLTSKE